MIAGVREIDSSKPPRRSRMFITVILAVFVAGLGTGVLADRLLLHQPLVRARILSRDMTPVLDKLALTPDQRVRADSILSRPAPASEALMIQVAEHLRSVSDSVDRELRLILTPAQRARLDSLRLEEPRFMLKRKTVTPGGSRIDTILIRDSARPPGA